MSMKSIATLTAGLLVSGLSAEAAASHQTLGSGQQVRTQLTASHHPKAQMKKTKNCKNGVCPVINPVDEEEENGQKQPAEGKCGEGRCG